MRKQNIVFSGPVLTGVIHIIDNPLQMPELQGETLQHVNYSGVIPTALLYPVDPALDGINGAIPDWTGHVSHTPKRDCLFNPLTSVQGNY